MGKNRFKPATQICDLRELEDSQYINNFGFNWNLNKTSISFKFGLTQQKIGGEEVSTNFGQYKIRIEYSKTLAPKVFIENPKPIKHKHMYRDKSLCLYHRDNFKWGDNKSIAYNLIPWTYMWIYYYEMWLKTGKWYGDEYQH